jgi:DNA adenine methylase
MRLVQPAAHMCGSLRPFRRFMSHRNGPLLRWVGGKHRLVHILKRFVPEFNGGQYFEPFMGAGSLFFALGPQNARLGDLNDALVNCFCCLRDKPALVWKRLTKLRQRRGRPAYYDARQRFNTSCGRYNRAALFIYLNRMCFNGIWRVNRAGNFNVPYGGKKRPCFPTLRQLRRASAILQNARVVSSDFETLVKSATRGDFVYLDPPYPPLNGTAFFTHYTKDRFGIPAQRRVARVFKQLNRKGCLVLLSNADTQLVRSLYREFTIAEISTQRWVASYGRRYLVKDLIITNFPAPKPKLGGRTTDT